jgi:ABC-type amino acid transport substrate-binding protein
LLALAALVAVPAASAGRAAPPTLNAGQLVVAFGDPAPGFASGTVRGNKVTNPRGYEVDLAKAIAKQLGLTPVWSTRRGTASSRRGRRSSTSRSRRRRSPPNASAPWTSPART